ncbi:manganese efflux pump MntP [Nitrosomonas eutropha]|nr:manganese efflux pump MntP [Nitrosomonas eutropha]
MSLGWNHSRMNFFSTMILALAMSTDAFAAAVGKGTALRNPRLSEALRTGIIFGVIEGLTPLVGWALGSIAADSVADWDHWIAFTLLLILGLLMIRAGLRAEEPEATPAIRHSFWLLAATGFATSIDAMAVGVSLAFIDNNILITAAAIGLATFLMVTLGVMVGRLIGNVAGKWAEILGGLALMGVGTVILYEHLTM